MNQGSPVLVLVHVVWATKARRPLLPPSFDGVLTDLLRRKAHGLGCELVAVGCASDHVHVVTRLTPVVALSTLVQRLKGGSAHDINADALMPVRIAWNPRYWAESLSTADLDAVIHYVLSQRRHHELSAPAELWQRSAL
jgi:putative transposase